MPSNETFADVQQPKRLAMFAGVFIAGLIGGAVFTSTMAHSQQTQQMRPIAQLGEVMSAQITSAAADPSVPDAAAALAHRRHDRPEAIAPTF